MKYRIILVIMVFGPFVYIAACNNNHKTAVATHLKFPDKLSGFGFFKGNMADLLPSDEMQLLELSSTLFTDYAEKQRLLKLPHGKKLIVKGDGLPVFPEGTILVKTFYYSKGKHVTARRIIETRLLVLKDGKWNAATYQWNTAQTEAVYTADAAQVKVTFKDPEGTVRKIGYHIPDQQECVSCHQYNGEVIPIGPKAMNLNRTVYRGGKAVNQLVYLQSEGFAELKTDYSHLTVLPPYADSHADLEHRARAYLEINCAHCHNPNGLAWRQAVMLGYKVPLSHTGIGFNKRNIAERMGSTGIMHMPKLGTTIQDKEGVKLIRDYLKSMKE